MRCWGCQSPASAHRAHYRPRFKGILAGTVGEVAQRCPQNIRHKSEAAPALEVWRECVRYGFSYTTPAAPSQADFSRKSICLGAKEESLMDYLRVIPGMDQPGTMATQEFIVSEFHGVKIDISLELDTDSIMFCDYFTPQLFCSQIWDFCGVKINISLELDANSITLC